MTTGVRRGTTREGGSESKVLGGRVEEEGEKVRGTLDAFRGRDTGRAFRLRGVTGNGEKRVICKRDPLS